MTDTVVGSVWEPEPRGGEETHSAVVPVVVIRIVVRVVVRVAVWVVVRIVVRVIDLISAGGEQQEESARLDGVAGTESPLCKIVSVICEVPVFEADADGRRVVNLYPVGVGFAVFDCSENIHAADAGHIRIHRHEFIDDQRRIRHLGVSCMYDSGPILFDLDGLLCRFDPVTDGIELERVTTVTQIVLDVAA